MCWEFIRPLFLYNALNTCAILRLVHTLLGVLRAGAHGWSVVHLHEGVAGLSVADVERDLQRQLPGLTCYFPAARAGLLSKRHPLNTYVFVICPKHRPDLFRLERCQYVDHVLREPDHTCVHVLSDADLDGIRVQEAGDEQVVVGARVTLTAGEWSGLEATVVKIVADRVKVLVELWSRRSMLTVPRNEVALL